MPPCSGRRFRPLALSGLSRPPSSPSPAPPRRRDPAWIRPVGIPALARRAALRSACAERDIPDVAAVPTLKSPRRGHFDLATLDPQGLASDKGVCHLSACGLEYPAEGGARYVHALRGILLVETFEVCEPQGLDLVDRQQHLGQGGHRDTPRLEIGALGKLVYPSACPRSCHQKDPRGLLG